MKMYAKIAVVLVASMAVAGCSKDDSPPADNGNPFGTGGSGGSSASGGTGGSHSGGTGGSAKAGNGGSSQGGGGSSQGGSAGQGQGGQGLDGGVDAPTDSGPDFDALPDAPAPPVDLCPSATTAFGTKKLFAGGETTTAFADAFNAEVAAMAAPGPLLIEFSGLDVKDEKAGAWKVKFGPLNWDGSTSKASFGDTPAELPFTFQSGWGIFAAAADASFKLHFDDGSTQTDIPVVRIDGFGASLTNKACDTLAVEQFDLIVPQDAAKDIPFHGSTVSALMGSPNRDCCKGTQNAWVLSLATQQDGLAVVQMK